MHSSIPRTVARTAIFRLFVSPFAISERRSPGRIHRRILHQDGSRFLSRFRPQAPRSYPRVTFTIDPKSSGTGKAPKQEQRPRNYGIEDEEIILVGEDGHNLGRTSTREVLDSLDLSRQALRVVARKAVTEADGDDDDQGMAICRIFNLEDEKAKQQTIDKKAQRKKLLEKKTKELELNWAIDPHDLTYKLKALRRFLEKGLRVDILLSKKKRGRTASVEEATNVLLQVRELATQMNVKEKRQEGRIGGTMTFTLEPEGSELL